MPTREELLQCNEKEILIQLRMAMAVLEERTTHLPVLVADIESRLSRIEADNKWIKRIVFSAVPVAPLLVGMSAVLTRLIGG